MVKRFLLLGAAASALTSPAFAGPKPPDVPSPLAWTPTYASGTTANNVINAITTPPNRGLTPIATSDRASWLNTYPSVGDNTGGYVLSGMEGGTGEAKARITCAISLIANDDPIRNYGQPGASHLHLGYGAEQWNAWTTYASLRNSRKSMCSGGSVNNTAYWLPAFTKIMGDGKKWVVVPRLATFYYRNDNNVGLGGHVSAHAPYGLRFVSGAHMDNNYSNMDAAIATANAQAGTAGRYSWGPNGKPHVIYACQGTTASPANATPLIAPYLKAPDGSDPWGGTCTAGKQISAQLDFNPCLNNVGNLWTSSGYDHVVPMVYDTVTSKYECPQNSYQIFTGALQLQYDEGGFSDYGNWTLSSDAAFQTMLNASASPRTIGSGESFHADWFDGWDPQTRYEFETHCMGVENGRAHECGDSQINDTTSLILNQTPPDGRRLTQVVIPNEGTRVPTTTANMWLAPTTTSGSHMQDMHGEIDVLSGQRLVSIEPFFSRETGQ